MVIRQRLVASSLGLALVGALAVSCGEKKDDDAKDPPAVFETGTTTTFSLSAGVDAATAARGPEMSKATSSLPLCEPCEPCAWSRPKNSTRPT